MHLTFHESEVPREFARQSFLRGHRELQGYMAVVHDGELRVLVSMDPAGNDGRYLLHVSASVGKPWAVGAFRAPSDRELREVQKRFMHRIECEEVRGDDPLCRHLWQLELQPGEPKV